MRKEINRIAMGSVDIYMTEFTGTAVADIPADNVIETEANHIGRTKDGGEVTYTTTYYNAKSDDGKAARNEMTDDSSSFSFGLITWNGDTITKIVPTASATVTGTTLQITFKAIPSLDVLSAAANSIIAAIGINTQPKNSPHILPY